VVLQYVLGVDVGTQGAKAALLDEDLNVVVRDYAEHVDLGNVSPGLSEHDADEVWWRGFKKVVGRILKQHPSASDGIVAVGCSGLGCCMLPVSAKMRPLGNAVLYCDTRSENEIVEMTDRVGYERILDACCTPLSSHHVGPKLLWFKKTMPELFKRTSKFLTTTNYITLRLTGNVGLDYAQASCYAPFFDMRSMDWNEDVLKMFDIDKDMFPQLTESTDVIGHVTKEAAEETGIPEGVAVVAATMDGFAEMLSIGSYEKKNVATLLYGTTSALTVVVDGLLVVEDLLLASHPIFSDQYIVVGATTSAGALTRWFRDNFGQIESECEKKIGISAYELLSKEAEKIPPGANGLLVLPYFSGERSPINDGLARGVIIGLTTYHSRGHVYRALLESIGYAIRHQLDALMAHGINVEKLVAAGGGTRSKVWVQSVSDITGCEQVLPQGATGSEIGAAYLAALGCGIIEDTSEINKAAGKESRRVIPNKRAHRMYEDYYEIYQGLYERTKGDMHTLAKLGWRS